MSLIFPIAVAIATAIALAAIFGRLNRARRPCTVDLDWCRDFSVAKYRPMERLSAQDDDYFLLAQPDLNPAMSRRLQAERRRIFRRYLEGLNRDFDQLLAAAKVLVVDTAEDRPDLARAFLRQKLAFSYAMAVTRCRLVLREAGVGHVDVRPLVRALGDLRMQLGAVAEHARLPAAQL